MLTTPKLNKLQRPKLMHKLPLSAATSTPSLMQFCRMVAKKGYQNVIPYLSVCDDLYHACTFAWDVLRALFTPYWKML